MNLFAGQEQNTCKEQTCGDSGGRRGGDKSREQHRYIHTTCKGSNSHKTVISISIKKEKYNAGKTVLINKRSNIKVHNITVNM